MCRQTITRNRQCCMQAAQAYKLYWQLHWQQMNVQTSNLNVCMHHVMHSNDDDYPLPGVPLTYDSSDQKQHDHQCSHATHSQKRQAVAMQQSGSVEVQRSESYLDF